MEVLTFVWYISSRKWATNVELTLQVFWYIINCRHCGNDLMIIHEILSFVHFHTCDTQFACYTKTVEDVNTEVATKPPCFEWMWRRGNRSNQPQTKSAPVKSAPNQIGLKSNRPQVKSAPIFVINSWTLFSKLNISNTF